MIKCTANTVPFSSRSLHIFLTPAVGSRLKPLSSSELLCIHVGTKWPPSSECTCHKAAAASVYTYFLLLKKKKSVFLVMDLYKMLHTRLLTPSAWDVIQGWGCVEPIRVSEMGWIYFTRPSGKACGQISHFCTVLKAS